MRNNIAIRQPDDYSTTGIRTLSGEIPQTHKKALPQILFIASYPPRECGIATYTQDLIKALNDKFSHSFDIRICALANENEQHTYPEEVNYVLDTDKSKSYKQLAEDINNNRNIELVLVQHEFGLFRSNESDFLIFLNRIIKPVMLVFHTVLPRPDEALRDNVQQLAKSADSLIVMTQTSATILERDYGVAGEKVSVIGHGTHLVAHTDKNILKKKYDLEGRKVLSTFGLLGSGKSIETTLDAMPEIVKQNPEVTFLIIGKTHPGVVKHEGEAYRDMLVEKIEALGLQENVQFVNRFLTLAELLEYLQLTDIYLFTSKDPNQAVSGTFSYALSCGCPIISTPIPHATEVLNNDTGIIIDFGDSQQLAKEVNILLSDEQLRRYRTAKGLHKIVPNSWENSALSHAILFEEMSGKRMKLHYRLPKVKLDHVKKMTTDFAMLQFSIINHPDIDSGYTLDDNARALIALCEHYEKSGEDEDLELIYKYFNFINFCLRPDGYFLNYVDEHHEFTEQNNETNLADSNGRAIWALGYLISKSNVLPVDLVMKADLVMRAALKNAEKVYSTRAMAFIIKGLYYKNLRKKSDHDVELIQTLANRIVQMYRHEAKEDWKWFEPYLTYANSTLPEALLMAYIVTENESYKKIAKSSFEFLLTKIYRNDRICVISNKGWMHIGDDLIPEKLGGEQPIDVAYTILTLALFYDVFQEKEYLKKMETAFDWFLGKNHLNQIIYNPCTGGCFDGLEDIHVNLNQGAESTLSYLIARFTVEKYLNIKKEAPKESPVRKIHYLRPGNYYQASTF